MSDSQIPGTTPPNDGSADSQPTSQTPSTPEPAAAPAEAAPSAPEPTPAQPVPPAPEAAAAPTAPPAYAQTPPAAPAYPQAPAYQAAPAYGAPAPAENPGRTLGIVAFILSFFVNIVGLILGIVAMVQSRKAGQKNGFALAAIIIGAVSIVLSIIGLIVFFASIAAVCGSGYCSTTY